MKLAIYNVNNINAEKLVIYTLIDAAETLPDEYIQGKKDNEIVLNVSPGPRQLKKIIEYIGRGEDEMKRFIEACRAEDGEDLPPYGGTINVRLA